MQPDGTDAPPPSARFGASGLTTLGQFDEPDPDATPGEEIGPVPPTFVTRLYGQIDADTGELVDSLSIISWLDPHTEADAAYELGDYSYFDEDDLLIGGRLAIWEPWHSPDRYSTRGTRLVWDASPDRYVTIASRHRSLDELIELAEQLTITADGVAWPAQPADLTLLTDGYAPERNHGMNDGGGVRARYDWEADDTYGEVEIHVHPAYEGELLWLRHVAFAETVVTVDGRPGYLLTVEPAIDGDPAEHRLVWMYDEVTIGVADGAPPDPLIASSTHVSTYIDALETVDS